MHTPSRPEDLDHPSQLWARAAIMAMVDTAFARGTEFALDEDGLWCHSTGAGGWWRLTVFEGGRAVFCGQDPDGSHTHIGGEQIDFLAGGPDWLPWDLLRDDADGNLFGFVYWWEDGAWHRIPYPEELREDGLEGAAPWVGSHEEFLGLTAASFDAPYVQERALTEAVDRFAALARDGKADADAVTALLTAPGSDGGTAPRLDAALDIAARAGILA
ncbi:hypothetical protein [Streptomyces sp. NRRL F-2664]|uniref:hypothetical protein n=1 Tax=Streptomyces sp. NRRL F-2664 TaxID=1463842 RepID=UPI0004CB130A|nr:hypothetical protein [Streptomyces sp. NRRL F-2664]